MIAFSVHHASGKEKFQNMSNFSQEIIHLNQLTDLHFAWLAA